MEVSVLSEDVSTFLMFAPEEEYLGAKVTGFVPREDGGLSALEMHGQVGSGRMLGAFSSVPSSISGSLSECTVSTRNRRANVPTGAGDILPPSCGLDILPCVHVHRQNILRRKHGGVSYRELENVLCCARGCDVEVGGRVLLAGQSSVVGSVVLGASPCTSEAAQL